MKRLKLRKEVKVITTLLCFSLLCTAVPTINAVAEDAGTEENTVETNTVDETTTDETVIDDDAVVEEQVVEEVESLESDLYTRLMNTTTIAEFEAIVSNATEEEYNLIGEDQHASIAEHLLNIDNTVNTNLSDNTDDVFVESEIIYPAVDSIRVAPLVGTIVMDD